VCPESQVIIPIPNAVPANIQGTEHPGFAPREDCKVKRMQAIAGILFLLASHDVARAADSTGDAKSFAATSLHLEQNATDGDVVEFQIKRHAVD